MSKFCSFSVCSHAQHSVYYCLINVLNFNFAHFPAQSPKKLLRKGESQSRNQCMKPQTEKYAQTDTGTVRERERERGGGGTYTHTTPHTHTHTHARTHARRHARTHTHFANPALKPVLNSLLLHMRTSNNSLMPYLNPLKTSSVSSNLSNFSLPLSQTHFTAQ